MQDRYSGDIGDYSKLAFCRAIERQGLVVGLNWYRTKPTQKEALNGDGSIGIKDEYRSFDPELADELNAIHSKDADKRSIKDIEAANLLASNLYYSELVGVKDERKAWHEAALETLKDADVVFLDPDNGMRALSVKKTHSKASKYAMEEEIADYINNGQTVILYQHRPRKKADHKFQVQLEQ